MDEREITDTQAAAHLATGASSAEARHYLREQARLARLQSEQIEEENLTRQRILKLEHTSAVFKVALELAVAAIVTIAALVLGAAVWSAATDNGLVVESFAVPPDLAQRGLTGDVVAARLLDKLAALQAQTQSNRASSSYANNWGSDIKVQIPDTGVSIGEFVRLLHTWLGHQTRISGEIWRTTNGIAVTARAGGTTSPTFTGSDGDIDKLMQQAAEAVYRATQPYRYAVYLANVGRNKDAQAAYESLIASGSDQDRAWAYIGLENIYTGNAQMDRARAALQNALAIRPGFIMAYVNLSGLEGQLQHDEAQLALAAKIDAHMQGARDSDMGELAWRHEVLQAREQLAIATGDFTNAVAASKQIQKLPEFSGQVANDRANVMQTLAFLHDGAAVRAAYASLPPTSNPFTQLQQDANYAFAQFVLGDPGFVVAKQTSFDTFLEKLGPAGHISNLRQFYPFLALGLAMTGDTKRAHAFIDKTPVDCTVCLRQRANIDAWEKNWGGADYWFARTVKDTPSPPFAWTDWGSAKLRQGDLKAAIAKFEIAHAKGPHYADPLELWGEALMREGRADLALAKFEEASRDAPNWGRLHLKWGEALKWSGHMDESKIQFMTASTLGLSAAERAELNHIK
jgi:tetratricopeptide (TPR) repeat protein